jgi:membrane-associated phospholipid phosphatase
MESLLSILRNRRIEQPLLRANPDGFVVPAADRPPTLAARLAVFPLLFVPWLILYESVVKLGAPPGSFQTYLPGELHWPIWQWTELLYVSPYVLVTLVPFVATTGGLLRRFTLAGILATVIGHLIFLTLPAVAPPRPFEPHGILGAMMRLDRDLDLNNGTAAFPSFHAFWAFLGASVFALRWPRWRYLAWAWATGVSLSCVFTGMHGAVDIVAGFALYLLTWFHRAVLLALNRHVSRLGVSVSQPFVEITWNVLLVAVVLHLMRQTVAPAVVLTMYLILWALTRLVHASLRQLVLDEDRVSSARPMPVRFGMPTPA